MLASPASRQSFLTQLERDVDVLGYYIESPVVRSAVAQASAARPVRSAETIEDYKKGESVWFEGWESVG